ncbi:MAG: PKD domain-containing protein [Methanolinea sp.]|nr:PKD domain-containing protein [Methanolinea sp.]
MMTVGTVVSIDSMNLSQSRVSLLSTSGDGTDMKSLALPTIRNIHRNFSTSSASWKGNTFTIVGPADSIVSGTGFGSYDIFTTRNLPVVRCQIPGATADVLLMKTNGSSGFSDLGTLLNSTDLIYLLHTRGVIAIRHSNYVAYGGPWSSSDFDPANLSYTLSHNAISVDDFTLNRSIAQQVSNPNPLFGTPPVTGEYILAAFRFDPVEQRIVTFASWPVIILDGNNPLALSSPVRYDQNSGQDLLLTFTNTTAVSSVTYLLVKSDEVYDLDLRVNMSALEETSDDFGIQSILTGNPFLFILKSSESDLPPLHQAISYSISSINNPTPPASANISRINITPGYGISGFAENSTHADIPHQDLETLLAGTFSIYGVGLNSRNEVVAIDRADLEVGKSPHANFTGTPVAGTTPLAVHFTDLSSDFPTTWAWDFGDGTGNSSLRHPDHVYQNPGLYDVTLTSSNVFGGSTFRRLHYIDAALPGLHADFTGTPTSGFVSLLVQFTDTSTGYHTQWDWDFGDGEGSTNANPSHVYTSAGTFTISLTVQDGTGNSSTRTRTDYITVHPVPPAPVAGFNGNITSGDAPLTVAFTDESSGSPYQWNWSFGDGQSSDARNPVHVYRDPGNFTVSLTVLGPGGYDTETKPGYIHVLPHPPVADFFANPTSGDAPLSVQFTDLSTGGPASWSWSFGDGGASADRDPAHIYSSAGNYTVNLTVTNAFGSDTLSRTRYIVVTTPTPPGALIANFVASPRRGYYPLSVVFEDTSTGNPLSWNWSFGDGTNSTEKAPIHIYRRSGEYTVSLTVSNATASDTLIRPSYITALHQSGGGGGGGGGGGTSFIVAPNATPTVSPTPTVTPTYSGQLPIGPDNRTTQPVVILSPDGAYTLSLGSGVRVNSTGGMPVTDLNLSTLQAGALPPLPGDPWAFTGFACRVSPAEAVFDPGVTLLLAFNKEQWELLSGNGLVLMWYDPVSGRWQSLETSVNEGARSVSARITRGGIYGLFTGIAVTGPTVPAATPTPTAVQPEGVAPSWIWWVPVLAILVAVAAALAVYLFKIRPGKGKPPENPDLLEGKEE